MRALQPSETRVLERDGVRVAYEVFGTSGQAEPTILFVPPWAIVHGLTWKAQVPYFARHCRVGWALETDAETLIATIDVPKPSADEMRAAAAGLTCPVLIIHGDQDGVVNPVAGPTLAEVTGGQLVMLEGSGHAPHARDPIKINRLLRDFVRGAGCCLDYATASPELIAQAMVEEISRPNTAYRPVPADGAACAAADIATLL
jgi:hypothetical protein